MSDYKTQLITDVTGALFTKMDPEDIELVSDEMLIALRDYEVTKHANLNTTMEYVHMNDERVHVSYMKYSA